MDQFTDTIRQSVTVTNLIILALMLFAFALRELLQGAAADRLGDPTPRQAGRLSLNPIVHLSILSSLVIPLVLMIATRGQFWFGSAKPMPIQPELMRRPRVGLLVVGLLGPLTHWLLALLTIVVYYGARSQDWVPERSAFGQVCVRYIQVNVFLMAINLLPFPPMDGYRILRFLLPRAIARRFDAMESIGSIAVMILIFLFPQVCLGMVERLMPTVMWLRRAFV